MLHKECLVCQVGDAVPSSLSDCWKAGVLNVLAHICGCVLVGCERKGGKAGPASCSFLGMSLPGQSRLSDFV